MALALELLNVLDNTEEPLNKRIKIADNAFKSVELPLQHKEAFLLKWMINSTTKNTNETWILLGNWLNSEQFKDLNRNEINNEEIENVIQLIMDKVLLLKGCDITLNKTVLNSLLVLIENRIFQQYFKYNLELFCKFVVNILEVIECPIYYSEFIKGPQLFHKTLTVEEKFHKHFLDIILPTYVRHLIKFQENEVLFTEISTTVQKSIFYNNFKNFENHLNQFFDESSTEKHNVPKNVIKKLSASYNLESEEAKVNFKIIFHAFCNSYNNFDLSYKFFVLIIQMLGFNVEETFKLKKTKLRTSDILLGKSLEITLEVLKVLSTNKNTAETKINNISLADFLKNLLKSIMFMNSPCSTVYKIFLKAIAIDPLVIESIINQIIVYIMLANNEQKMKEYEDLVIAIFEVFAKLHRIENFIAKIVPALHKSLEGKNIFEETYNFAGVNEIGQCGSRDIVVDNVFTSNILEYFTKCISGLASWQVINLFKTFLHHMGVAVSNLEDVKETKFVFLEILSTLTCWVLQSVRMAEHTVAANVVEKFVKGLNDLKDILTKFGTALLNREHNQVLMRGFLNVSFYWAEVYMTLDYYNSEVELKKSVDNNHTSCNLTYLHSYLSTEQWYLISERITNFGEKPCKRLLQKLYIQKLRSMLIFEEHVSSDIVTNIIKSLQNNLDDNWHEIMLDKFVVNNVLQKMDSASIIFLAEKLIKEQSLFRQQHITNSLVLINAVNFVVLAKITKSFKQKRKLDENAVWQSRTSNIMLLFTVDLFLKSEEYDFSEIFNSAKEIHRKENDVDIKISQEKINNYLNVLKSFPVIFSSNDVQKSVLLYLFLLHKDTKNFPELKKNCESILIGVLQCCKFELLDIFDGEMLCKQIVDDFDRSETVFSIFIENVFRHEKSIRKFENCLPCLIQNIGEPAFLNCSITVINSINKLKRTKIDSAVKAIANQYRDKIFHKIVKVVSKKEPEMHLVESYASSLKHFLSSTDTELLQKLLNKLDGYINYALNNYSNNCIRGYLLLFGTILNNKQKITSLEDDVILKVWNCCKKFDIDVNNFEEYSQLVNLIFRLIPNEEFSGITSDLLSFTEQSIKDNNFEVLCKQLKIWESILTCNVNMVKIKIWQEMLENLFQSLLSLLRNTQYDEKLFKNIVQLEENVIQTHHFLLTPALVDMFIVSVTILTQKDTKDFCSVFNLSASILEKLLKSRTPQIMDRLPPFLQQYRLLLNGLCGRSNSDLNLEATEIKRFSDCAHRLEKLTNNLVANKKDMGRIAMYLVADILEKYEQVTLYSNVKLHLNNCIYGLISLCDHHAVSFLMRVLSSASTEMFKMLYENYKKYYMFTGKV